MHTLYMLVHLCCCCLYATTTLMCATPTCPQVRMSGYERAVKEAAVCTTMAHRNVVATYRYEIKALATRQEAGQFLEVDVGAVPPEQASDFKLYIIQERCDANLAEAIDYQVSGETCGAGWGWA
jgi:hypothetical protein